QWPSEGSNCGSITGPINVVSGCFCSNALVIARRGLNLLPKPILHTEEANCELRERISPWKSSTIVYHGRPFFSFRSFDPKAIALSKKHYSYHSVAAEI